MRSRVLAQALSMAALGSAMMSGGIPNEAPSMRYEAGSIRQKTALNKRQQKVRKKAKAARKSRKKNRR